MVIKHYDIFSLRIISFCVNFKLMSQDGKALSRKPKFMPCKTAPKAIAFYLQPPIDASIIVVLLHTHAQIIFLPY